MAAIVAVDKDCCHILLSGWVFNMAHACILPRILYGICKDNVFPSNLKTTVEVGVVINSWSTHTVFSIVLSENSLTVRNPVAFIDKLRSHGVLLVWDLEPCELGAVLPSPLSHVVLSVHLDISKGNSVILIECDTVGVSVLLQDSDLKLHVGRSYAGEHITKVCSAAVLHSQSKGVSNEPHEISIVYAIAIEGDLHELFIIRGKLVGNSSFKIVSQVLNGLRAFRSAPQSGLIDIHVKVVEVENGLDHTR